MITINEITERLNREGILSPFRKSKSNGKFTRQLVYYYVVTIGLTHFTRILKHIIISENDYQLLVNNLLNLKEKVKNDKGIKNKQYRNRKSQTGN